jgi:hypothetical protein
MRDPYDVLGVPRSATEAQIKKAFRSLAKQLHPDANNSDPEVAARFAELNAAYEILGDKNKRTAFDRGKIDAEGQLAKREFPRFQPTATVLVMTLAIAAMTSLAIHSLMPQENVRVVADQGSGVPSCVDANQKAVTGQADPAPQPRPRLVLQQHNLYTSGDVIPLGLQIDGETTSAALEIRDLPPGTTLSVGRPLGTGQWRVPAGDVGSALVHPPAGFSGTLQFAAELRLANDAIADSGEFRLQWPRAPTQPAANQSTAEAVDRSTSTTKQLATSTPAARNTDHHVAVSPSDRDQIELLIALSQKFMSQGDVATARILLRRAAEVGDARAALALGATYDPVMLAIVRARGVAADLSLARDWYKKASDFGSQEAEDRLKLLTSASLDGAKADH